MNKRFLLAMASILGLVLCNAALMQGQVEKSSTGRVMGQIGIRNVGPMMDGEVVFFDAESGPPPSLTKYWRVPSYIFGIDANARFTAELPQGTYYLGAIERKLESSSGPPEEGEYIYLSRDKKGNPRKLTVWENSVTDLGLLNDAEVFKRASLAKTGITSIEGVIRNEHDEPVQGLLVFAYTDPAMSKKPLFVSDPSDKDGKYVLRVAGSGKFYLKAQSSHRGGSTGGGEFAGMYGNRKPVALKKGETRRGVNIKAYRTGV